jgi:hypothetical protein
MSTSASPVLQRDKKRKESKPLPVKWMVNFLLLAEKERKGLKFFYLFLIGS